MFHRVALLILTKNRFKAHVMFIHNSDLDVTVRELHVFVLTLQRLGYGYYVRLIRIRFLENVTIVNRTVTAGDVLIIFY